MTQAVAAFGWGLFSGGALVIGALLGYFAPLSKKVVSSVMSFGAGVLISALCFELLEEAFHAGGFFYSSIGLLAGGVIYSSANYLVKKRGAKHRKRSGHQQSKESEEDGSGTALAIGALLDGIPESIVIGLSLATGGGTVNWVTVVAVFLSNLPEGLSSAAGMKNAGRSITFVLLLWGLIALASGVSAYGGFVLASSLSQGAVAVINSLAAGAILTMIIDTMVPEAFEETHDLTGLVVLSGFIVSFYLSKSQG